MSCTPQSLPLKKSNKTRSICSQFSAPQTQELKPTTSTAKTPLFAVCPLTEAEVSKLLLSSNPKTCPLYPILRGNFATAFKQARVTPLLKKPTLNISLTDSYRPVSLLPFIAKMRERVVFNQLSSFLSEHNLLDAYQSGFRRGHSTETALLSVTEALQLQLQKLIPNHQFSFCWIYLLLLTLLTIRSS